MSDSQKHKYKLALERALVEIEEYLSKSEDSAEAVVPDKSLGRLSRMEAMQDQQMVLELRRRRKRRRLEILNALKRLEESTYGKCILCGVEIVGRLLSTSYRWFRIIFRTASPPSLNKLKWNLANPLKS